MTGPVPRLVARQTEQGPDALDCQTRRAHCVAAAFLLGEATMFHPSGQLPFTAQCTGCLGFPRTGVETQSTRFEGPGLPSFVSSAPPRSEGEALLRRIFSRTGSGV
ncbi:hypothetical protein [Vitiosangium sp. GDMCC 1.1324]|uniref:hypothetical protein n=1 Tax=Vitiosangium sp. (strain GDMCC 1.1324) TaxID=2138576 RepID=UPI000D39664A|nr:hypothetical protein [Vitiosangium sp. GDMCC 1.1324]PTL83469.1 hypothetical protein DAT35_16000 [Vitiosangium sp. GDMCC 1.1324]